MVALEAPTVVAAADTLADTILERAVAEPLVVVVVVEFERAVPPLVAVVVVEFERAVPPLVVAVVVVELEWAPTFAFVPSSPVEFWLGERLTYLLPTDWSVSSAAWPKRPLVEPFGLRVVQ
jgi:hypothetical protein